MYTVYVLLPTARVSVSWRPVQLLNRRNASVRHHVSARVLSGDLTGVSWSPLTVQLSQ